ncbi:uncharacterized protein CANTADRAFT_57329 [Suhomyces tanzawaensis NRRL Y-17324]|uniref:FAR-17a/AIG1-like protein n=1 Tax=Suhomyces tanzawaensis NRRL Y-17324 TaxID=984487 RepID=A0A1E4SB88_9ASCO|nr:uncharacterized protein CANTADRAFT_57329 [Suhomyces tanzawaensis NRRL Y-17324]ODV76736.1 hypothetical protein CANTADRAFT_57329 [Suhomyces tanzawaensis NRRL Y-17324]
MSRVVGNKAILAIDVLSLAVGSYGLYENIINAQLPDHLVKAGNWQFLTNLSLVYSLVVFGVGVLAHLFHSPALFQFKNTIHPVGLALESIVAMVYWPLRLFLIELLAKDGILHIPVHVDLAIHLMPVVSLLIDYLVFMPRWTIKTSTALGLVVFLSSAYYGLLKVLVDVENGAAYPYVFMNVETETERVFVFIVVGGVAFLQFLIFKGLYDWIVGKTEEADEAIDRFAKKNQ